jgi:hypothetical protein
MPVSDGLLVVRMPADPAVVTAPRISGGEPAAEAIAGVAHPAAGPVALAVPAAAGDSPRQPVQPATPDPGPGTVFQATARGRSFSDSEMVLVELQLGRIASRTVEAYRVGNSALVPLGTFLDMAEIRSSRRPDGAIEAMVQPGNVPLTLEPARRTLHVGKEKIALADSDLVVTNRDIYLSTTVLGRAFNLEWAVSWPDLQVAVVEPNALPVARRIRRESLLRARGQSAATDRYAGLQLGMDRSRLNGLVLDYSVLTPTSGINDGAYSTMLGLDLFGGSLALGMQSQNGTHRAPRTDASWTGVWRQNPWLAQAQIGDGISSGPRPRSVRGVSLTNSPYVRPSILGDIPFSGQLGAGWTVEAYRGGRLVGFDSVNALGRYSFDVPIEYGENAVDFIAYGPFGEVREFNQTYRMQSDGLPARRFEYGVSAGACRTDRCRATGNIDLRYGLSTRWTARAGLDQFWRDSLGNLSHPYVGLLGGITNSLSVEGEAVKDAVVRGAVRFEPSVNLRMQAEGYRFAQGIQAPLLTPAGRLSQVTLSAMLRPADMLGGLYLEATLDRVHAAASDITSSRIGASIQVADVRLVPAVRFQRQTVAGTAPTSQSFASLNTFVLPHPALGKILGRMTARTSLELEQGVGPTSASGYVGMPVLHGLRAETGVTWFRGGRGPGVSLLIAAELPTVRSYTTVTAGGGLPATGTQYVTGSAIYNPSRGGVDFSGSPGLARSGVTGRVFLDANGNGRYDKGERLIPDVRVVVGQQFATSDSSGDYRVWDVMPYEPTAITVDSASLSSPLWVPAFAQVTVEPSPNRYRQVDIPILLAAVIEGRVTRAGGERNTGGVTLVMTHKKSGERRVFSTFSDGTFYLMGVRPGAWELSVDPKCLELLRARAEPLHLTVKPDPDGASIEGLVVELH